MRNSATVDKRMAGVEEMREVVMRPGELVPVRIEGKDQPLSTGSEVYSGKAQRVQKILTRTMIRSIQKIRLLLSSDLLDGGLGRDLQLDGGGRAGD